jgi:adenylate kinase
MESYTFVFFGMIGSGKGTQVKLLIDYLKNLNGSDTVYISPGVEFRKLMTEDTFTAKLVSGPMDRGELLPGFLTDSIMADILMTSLSPEKNIIADGYPRAVAQAKNFEQMMEFYKRKNIKIIYIEVDKEEAVKRITSRGRHDDTSDGIKKRFEEYTQNVLPAMEYLRDKENYKIYTINGEQTIENVHQELIATLGI